MIEGSMESASGRPHQKIKYEVGTYSIDPQHSRISFVINHLVIAEVEGRFNDVDGMMILTDPFSNSSVRSDNPCWLDRHGRGKTR